MKKIECIYTSIIECFLKQYAYPEIEKKYIYINEM